MKTLFSSPIYNGVFYNNSKSISINQTDKNDNQLNQLEPFLQLQIQILIRMISRTSNL